jgi:hypothetical protein
MLTTHKLIIMVGLLAVAARADLISVVPSPANVNIGQSFSLNIQITGTTDLYGYQFDLGFDPSILAATSTTEGSFLPTGGSTFYIPGTVDNSGGAVTFTAGILDGALSGVTGAGVLSSVNFTALAAGTSAITLFNIVAIDSFGQGRAVTATNGTVNVSASGGATPEPSTLFLTTLGFAGLVLAARVRRLA